MNILTTFLYHPSPVLWIGRARTDIEAQYSLKRVNVLKIMKNGTECRYKNVSIDNDFYANLSRIPHIKPVKCFLYLS